MALSLRGLHPPRTDREAQSPDPFSESRALEVVHHLSENIGVRLNGTPAHKEAADYLATQLRTIPGVAVEIQEASGTHIHKTAPMPAFVYRTRNVVGRIPGRTSESILLNAHFDTYLDSVGAADDAAGVAAILEAVRVLAKEAPFERTILVNLNGAEELGLLGATGFLQHRWAKDVRTYIYIEALPGGKTILLDAGPAQPWLVQTYARVVDGPVGSVIGQELMRTGLLPHNGDFTPFHEAGLSGLDLAMTLDGWAYHTMLDRPARIEPGSLHYMGKTLVALTRELANNPARPINSSKRPVYYSVLGRTMVVYSGTTARILGVLTLLAFLVVVSCLSRREVVSWREVTRATVWSLLSVLAGLLSAVGAAAVVAIGFGRPPGWLAQPGWVLPAFGGAAFAAVLAVHAWWRCGRRFDRRHLDVAHLPALLGGTVVWSLWLAASVVYGVGSGYVPMFWVAGGTLALLLLSTARPAARIVAPLLLLPALVVTIDIPVSFANYFIPMRGMLTNSRVDVLVAAVVGVGVVAASLTIVPFLEGRLWRASAVSLGVGVLGLIVVSFRFPYTEMRPKRVSVTHLEERGESGVVFSGRESFGMEKIRATLPPETPDKSPTSNPHRSRVRFQAPPPPMPQPKFQVAQQTVEGSNRRVRLRILPASPILRLQVPAERLIGWSLGSLADTPPIDGTYRALFYDLGPDGHEVVLHLRGREKVELRLRGTDGKRADSEEVRAVLRALPSWVTASATSERTWVEEI